MIILALRTDKPEAELYLYNDSKKLAEIKWPAHLKLAETLNSKIEEVFTHQNLKNFRRASKSGISYDGLGGVAIFRGPGSFTGLRIGMSVANALAYAQKIPIIASGGPDWLEQAVKDLKNGKNDKIATPEYGAPPHITKPSK